MAKKSAHPSRRLFDYLSGTLDARASRAVEEHLAACADCAAVADVVRALHAQADAARASEISNLKSETSEEHPDVSALASFFYNKPPRAHHAAVAAHVALCRSCADELAEYARAERAATLYTPSQAVAGGVPAATWEMIREWEESSFAKPKLPGETVSRELLAKLLTLLSEQREQLQDAESASDDIVPVLVVDREGRLRRVERFRKVRGARGTGALRHADASEQFDNKPVHALLDFGDEYRVVISDRIHHDTLPLAQQAARNTKPLHADYFIIED